MGALPPNPRKLFVKSLIKNFKLGDFIEAAYINSQVKVLIELFQKFAGAWGQSPQDLDLDLII